jgi:glycosyltransferase involved in cell wall biosynthesis
MRTHLILRLLAASAVASIRHRGAVGFLRHALAVRNWFPLVFPTADLDVDGRLQAEGEGRILGAFDELPNGTISRTTGQISGWTLSRSHAVDRVEVFVDAKPVGRARICLPRSGIRSRLPDANICGFQINVPSERIPADQGTLQVAFVTHLVNGGFQRFPPREMRLGPRSEATNQGAAGPVKRRGCGKLNPRSTTAIKVACFTHDLGYGGGQLYLQELLRRLAPLEEIDFVVRSPRDGPLGIGLSRLGVATEICPEPSKTDADDHSRETDAVSRWLIENDFDCVLANTLAGHYAINAAVQAGLPNIWSIHESFPLATWSAFYTQERAGSAFFLSRLEAALRQCSAVTFESDATRNLFLTYGSEDRFLKVPYGIDTSAVCAFLRGFDRDRERARRGILNGDVILLCIGTVEPRKQQILLTRAFEHALPKEPRAKLWLVGESPSLYSMTLRQYLERKKLGQTVRLFPVVPDPYPWYGMADGFVLLSDVESMPRSLIEAMAFGLPALATRVFGVTELIDDGKTGMLVEPNSVLSASEGLERLLCLSETDRKEIGGAARQKIQLQHDSRGYAETYLALIRRLVG